MTARRATAIVAGLAAVAAACFDGAVPEGLPCSESRRCPERQQCSPEGVCVAGDGARADASRPAGDAGGRDGGASRADGGPVEPGRLEQVTLGDLHTCARLDTGAVHCWGAGDRGRLGNQRADDIGDDESPADQAPVPLGGRAIDVSAGADHTCAVVEGADANRVVCWGVGENGRLGHGDTDDIGDDEAPKSVVLAGSPIQIAAGELHTCALLDDGGVVCWGAANHGQLGTRSDEPIGDDEPPVVADTAELGADARAITAGDDFTCAVLVNDTVTCWGHGADGRLGYGNSEDVGDDEPPSAAGSVELGGGVAAVAAGRAHACARLLDGSARCWGDGVSGKLGYAADDDVGDDELPIDRETLPLGGAGELIATGRNHSCADVDDGDELRCWGEASSGRLGYGGTADIGDDEPPDAIDSLDLDDTADILDIDGGDRHTCAVTDGNELYCWGENARGQLGLAGVPSVGASDPATAADPVPVPGLEPRSGRY